MSEKVSEEFAKALHDFTFNASCGDAIRHLADSGMTVIEIAQNLTYPATDVQIRNTVWKHYIDKGIICFEDPHEAKQERQSFVKEYTSTGRMTFRMITEVIPVNDNKYYVCDFGKKIYQDRENFIGSLAKLDARDKEYILGLPWPLQKVYHIADERMDRIMKLIDN